MNFYFFLQKTPNLELATSALTFDKNPAKILTNNLSSIEDASLAHIVTFKTVSVKVNQIKTKFGLNEHDEDWREKVNEIGKKKKKKIEKETNKNRNKERKEAHKKTKELVKKRDELLETIDDTVGSDEEDNLDESSAKSEKKSTNFVDTDIKKKNLTKKKSITDPLKTADPFFLTGTGESYLATKIVDRIQPNGPNDGLDRKERRAQQFGSKPKAIPKSHKSYDTPAVPIRPSKPVQIPDDLHPSWAAKMKSKGIDKFQGKKMKFDDDEPPKVVSKTVAPQAKEDAEKIHPSWAAKQKLKPVISEFKGSKIVFDD